MPWLLCRYILGELLRVFAITAAVLVLVTAIGAAIKPLAADDLIGPLQTAKYIMLATVPMLQFALPFAAGFAATIVLHRLTSDNEILAAAVSGISYRTMMVPMAATGAALLIVMLLLTQLVIPRFWGLMDKHLAADVTRMFQASIAKGLPLKIGDWQIYADGLRSQPNPPGSEASMRLHLTRLAAAQVDSTGRIITDVTARQAAVDIYYTSEGQTQLMLATRDTVLYDERQGQLFHTPGSSPSRPITVPGAFQHDPMFMTQSELLHLDKHPDEDPYVKQRKDRLATALRRFECAELFDRELAERGRTELIEPRPAEGAGAIRRRVIVSADRFVAGQFRTDDGRRVKVRTLVGSRVESEIEAVSAVLRPVASPSLDVPTFDLILTDCIITDVEGGGTVNERARVPPRSDLTPEGLPPDDSAALPYAQLLERSQVAGDSVRSERERLEDQVQQLRLEIKARLLRRYALSATAFLLLLLGATLAMWMRNSLPLATYVWAFAPSIINLMLISGGDHMIRQGAVTGGIFVMWAGNGLLALMLVGVFWRLTRH